MQSNIVFTFISVDKPGIVEKLAAVVAQAGGNWLESRMTKLAGKFTGIVQISIADDKLQQLQAQLLDLNSKELILAVDTTQEDVNRQKKIAPQLSISIIGLDRPGLVREITQTFSNIQINVSAMHSLVERAAMSGELLFKTKLKIDVPQELGVEVIEDEIERICQHLDLDWNIET